MTHLPEPTAWPVALAMGVTLAAAGLVGSPVVFSAGALLTIAALAGWIGILVRGDHE